MNNRPTITAFILLLLFMSGSVWLVFEYVSNEKERDIDDWQARLGIMAESQQYSVEDWIVTQLGVLESFAENPLLQLYVSEKGGGDDQRSVLDETRRGQTNHLRNLVNATAARAGVYTPLRAISSNEENRVLDGIAIVNDDGIQMATRYFPVSNETVASVINFARKSKVTYVSDIFDLDGNAGFKDRARILLAVPVHSIQSVQANDVRAHVIAVINPYDSLFKLLMKSWVTVRTEESLLASLQGSVIEYLSPLKNGAEIFNQQDAGKKPGQLRVAGKFIQLQDYRGEQVLATSRKIHNTSMVLIQKIDMKEVLAESTAHRDFILIVFLLLVFLIAMSFVAIWRHATSLHLQKATRKLTARAELLNAISNSINDHIFLLDHNDRLVFINNSLAQAFSIKNRDIRGKALNHVFNCEITKRLLEVKEDDVCNVEMRLQMDDCRHDYHVSVVSLNHPDYRRSHLYVMHDITDLKDAQGKHNRLMEGVISTLTQLIDKHDPHCAYHSERTRLVAVAIARAMGVSQQRTDMLSMAALLANIGKLHIPAEILTTVEPLTDAEASMLRDSTRYSVEILKDLKFDGPVVEFVSQKNEYLDGSGYPKGVSGGDIFQESRILAVANAFVAMTSARAYRKGMPVREVLDMLMSEADSKYDRHVVAALFHVTENYPDWVNWHQSNDSAN